MSSHVLEEDVTGSPDRSQTMLVWHQETFLATKPVERTTAMGESGGQQFLEIPEDVDLILSWCKRTAL